ncbi:Carboxypeptidase regulatory-like domain-containing protein [Filimonas lacunae]|uniref:Carboxypeptidase regulatory-like domain-containing protein n=1 Tax=Filimonas lacunae TaxID=477680 RepID=A0A173MQT2_9BACT|nr:carboxypeptidase-like regulatory domain-containing protein [Filimonas lacunae]BAV10035.1 oligopeptide ABC transporter, periplasmic oligopeptide-binding protein OppA [Filimonas lacunae]SIS82943.1 Carboxypeptidase regulatory-like domain-containing protein [Filimonas lacunae]
MGYIKYVTGIVLLLLGFAKQPLAQVNITIGVTPPYSPYLSNYTSSDANKVFMTLQNTTNNTLQVRLAGSATGDNGIAIQSKPGFVSSQMITLAPFQVRQLNGSALSEILDLNNFDIKGIDRNTLARTLRLPEGNYSLCVQALDYNSGRLLSGAAPLGCALLTIAYPEPPVLVNPLPGDSVNAATPQTVIFNWMNPGAVPVGTEYTLQIQEMPARNANPNQVLDAASFPLLSQKVRTTSYVYNVGNLALKKDKYYAWRVVATDPSGRILFKNNGTSGAAVFKYGRAELRTTADSREEVTRPAIKMAGNSFSITGVLSYRFHSTADAASLPAAFNGVKADTLHLANEQLQLCYGLCTVAMSIKKTTMTQTVSRTTFKSLQLPEGAQVANVGKDSVKITYLHIDSIPVTGLPGGYGGMQPAGVAAGGLGQVIATTTTDSAGNYTFAATTTKRCYIAEASSSGTALIYCYYINIKNKHYSDPAKYIYVVDDEGGSYVNASAQMVFADNYKLSVRINRDKEFSADKGKQENVSLENKADDMVDIYVLRKGVKGGNAKGVGKYVPAGEGDNTGKILFASQADKKPTFTEWANYYIVAKKSALTQKVADYSNPNNFQAKADFYNLVNNLDNTENYYVYAEYKGASVYFDIKEYGYQPAGAIPEYRPLLVAGITSKSVELKPAYVSVKVKGVLKYQFKNTAPAPLANVNISFRSILWTMPDVSKGETGRQYDITNKNGENRVFATATTDKSGYFELNAGLVGYNDYSVGNALFLGLDQFITINNPYYGSPDKSFRFLAGNTYNVGELVARVKEYAFEPIMTGKNTQTNLKEKLAGQRVFLCRKASVKPQQWGIPANEGPQKNLPVKQLHDADNVLYNVIGYAESGSDGKVHFDNLVARDFNNANDQYYVYAESGITSSLNYSTQYGAPVSVSVFHKLVWPDYYPKQDFVFNKDIVSASHIYEAKSVELFAMAPYIEGGVYPQSNNSATALPGVTVRLYDMKKALPATKMETEIKENGVLGALLLESINGNIQIQETQVTGNDALFRFSDPTSQGKYKGWKLVTFSKNGFITGHKVIYSGSPMVAGVKETVKGFLLPPQLVHVKIKDAESGKPIAANVVVGDQFSWGSQKIKTTMDFFKNQYVTSSLGVDLTTPYGSVTFTVIPEDNVHYRTQTFTEKIKVPNFNGQATSPTQTLPDFEMYTRRNRISVCLLDAQTSKGLMGTVTIMDVPQSSNPAANPVLLLKDHCKDFSFEANIAYYRVQVASAGHVTKTLWVSNNSNDDIPKDLLIKLEPALTISGKVTQNGKPVKDARVYVQELSNVTEVYSDATGAYSLDGLPLNKSTVTISAVKTGLIGESKKVKLEGVSTNTSNGNSSGGNGAGVTGVAQNNYSVGGNIGTNINLSGAANNAKNATSSAAIQKENTQTVHFALTGNDKVDLSSLYGFPVEMEALTTGIKGTFATGSITVTGNSVFGIDAKAKHLHFTAVKLKDAPAPKKPLDGIDGQGVTKTKMQTESGEIPVDDDGVDVTVHGGYSAKLSGFNKGITITSYNKSDSKGTIRSTVTLNSNNLVGNVQWKGTVSLDAPQTEFKALSVSASDYKTQVDYNAYKAPNAYDKDYLINVPVANEIPVFASETALSNSITGNYTLESKAGGVHYTLNNIYRTEASNKSFIAKDGVHLMSVVHTKLENVASPDIKLNIGEVRVTDKAMSAIGGTTEVVIPLDNWRITSKSWYIQNGNLELTGNVEAGAITVPAKGLEIGETTIGFGDLELNNIQLAGVMKLNFNQSQTMVSFGFDKAAQYGTLYDKKYGCWSLSLLPKVADSSLTEIAGLPDLAYGDKLRIMNISLYSKGNESRIILKQAHPSLTLNNFSVFAPFEIENGKDYLKINGALNFSIPGFTGTDNAPYSLNYTAENGKLIHKHAAIAGLKMITNGIRVEFSIANQTFTGNRLELTGIIRDKVTNSPYGFTVKFVKYGATTRLDVDTTIKNTMNLGTGQQMRGIKGAMVLDKGNWNNFWFEGDVFANGMTEDKPTHMGFEVKGDLVANKAEIGVKNMPFPMLPNSAFNLTYDFEKKAVVGSLQITDMKTPAATFDAAVEMLLGGIGEWYFLGSVNIKELRIVPFPLNGAGGAFCVGSTTIDNEKLQIIQPVFHNGILPNGFNSDFGKMNGALFVAAVDVKLPLPTVDIDIAVASIKIGYGLYANAYAMLSFDETTPTVIGGVKIGAYVNVNGGASIGIACAGVSLSAEINAQGNLKMILPALKGMAGFITNPKDLITQSYVKLNVEMMAQLGGSAYVGFGVCNSSCKSVKVWGVTVPPGCHKEGIGKTLTLIGGIDIEKKESATSPNQAYLYVNLLDEKFGTTIKLPYL